MRRRLAAAALALSACACALVIPGTALAADGGAQAWVVPAPRLLKETYFSNLRDGDSIETPFLLKFGLTGMGIAPIVKPLPMTGHHHLLVDRDLPLDFTKPLPFNEQYIHFGKGQMETVLTFAPGDHTLRLVLADDKHIPNFVYSKPLHIKVTKKNDVDPKSLVVKSVAILGPRSGEHVSTPFRVAFHASGLNVSNLALKEAGTGHFRLRMKPDAGKEEVIEMDNGYTEVWLKPPAGGYSAKVEFIDNVGGTQVLAASEPVAFKVDH
jgi:hypothetical protein